MDDLPRQKLAELIRRYGRDVASDARRCEALLRDVCPQHKREIFVLVSAAKESVGVELLDDSTGAPKEALFSRLTGRLHENLGLPESLSRWAVESWALALGVASPKDFRFPFKCPGCGASGTMPTQLAGQTVACPKCKVVLSISDDGRKVSVGDASGVAGQTVNASSQETASAEEHDLFAEFPRVSAEEILRQTLRRVLADGIVTEEERAEVAKLRKDLGIAPDLAARVLAEVKAEMGLEQPGRARGLSDTATPLPTGRPSPSPASRASSPVQQPVVPPRAQPTAGKQGKHSPADETLEQSLQEFFRKHGYWPRWDPKHRKPDAPPPRSPPGSGVQEPRSPAPPPRPAPNRPQRPPPPTPVPPVPPVPSGRQYQPSGISFHPVLGMLIASVAGTALGGLLSQNFSYVPYSPGEYLSWSDGPIAVGRALGMLAGFVLAVVMPIVWAKQDYQSLLGAVAKCVILIPIGLIICPLVGMCIGMLAALLITALFPVLLGIALGIAGGALLAVVVKTYTQRDEMLAGCWLGALAGGIISAIAWGTPNRFLANTLFVTPFAWAGYAGTNAINTLLSGSPAFGRPYVRWLVLAYLGLFVLGMFSNSTILGLLVTGGLIGGATATIYKRTWQPAVAALGCIIAPLLGAWLGSYGAGILADLRNQSRGSTSGLPASNARPTGEIITNSIGMKLVLIPSGEFLMGAPNSDTDAKNDERPQHSVRITRAFYLGVYEVTQAEYKQVMDNDPSDTKGDSLPVKGVTWDDAVEFCRRLGAREGKTYRLPSEAEWEYACRAGTTTKWSFGDSDAVLGNYAWTGLSSGQYTGSTYQRRLHPVGQKSPNAWGLFDMLGNVNEWCADWYDESYYSRSPSDDPNGPSSGTARVVRGGSYNVDGSSDFRSSSRGFSAFPRNTGSIYTGFRVAITPATLGQPMPSAPPARQRGTDATSGRGAEARREVPWMPDEEPRSFTVTSAVSGLAFSGEQSKRINELGSQHYLRLYATRKKLDDIYTDEQNKASHDAMEAARNAGKTDSEVLQAGRDAVKLTEQQKAERKALLAEIINENKRLEAEVMAALTNDQRAKLKERRERLKPYVDYDRYFR